MGQTFEFEQDSYGMMTWKNARTLDRYRELNSQHPDDKEYGVFFAFGNKQFSEGVKKLISRGYIKEGEEERIAGYGGGLYGLPSELVRFMDFYKDKRKRIASECDPQEVYCYEFNNHESMIAFDGDKDALQLVLDIWGADAARKVRRFCAFYSTESLIQADA